MHHVTVAIITLSSVTVQQSTSSILGGSEDTVMTQLVPMNVVPKSDQLHIFEECLSQRNEDQVTLFRSDPVTPHEDHLFARTIRA